jgi:LacI family transcriptional regulator
LRGSNEVSAATIKQVAAVAQEMGYVPNRYATGLKNAKSKMIAIVSDSNFFLSRTAVMPELMACIQEANYTANLFYSNEFQGDPLEQALGGQPEGIIAIAGKKLQSVYAARAQSLGVPIVFLLGSAADLGEIDAVTINRQQAGYLAASHLLSTGHKRVGMVFPENDPVYTEPKVRGFVQALTDGGNEHPQRYLFPRKLTNDWVRDGYDFIGELLAMADRPDALFCSSARMAIGCFGRLRRGDLRVPEDLALLGYENSPEVAYLEVALSMVEVPTNELARLAVETVLHRIGEPEGAPMQRVLPPVVVARESCGFRQPGREAWKEQA